MGRERLHGIRSAKTTGSDLRGRVLDRRKHSTLGAAKAIKYQNLVPKFYGAKIRLSLARSSVWAHTLPRTSEPIASKPKPSVHTVWIAF